MKLILLGLFSYTQAKGYDYIVVGSGPGGGTLATELALKKFQVLLIEAGPDYFEANQTTPVFHSRSSEDPNIAFDFQVQHYNDGKSYYYPRAGNLGGCSTHNAQIAMYPNTQDFNYMKSITGDPNWSEKNMREYFIRMEQNQYPGVFPKLNGNNSDAVYNLRGHGYKGWFPTSYSFLLRQLKLDVELIDKDQAVEGNPIIDVNGYVHGSNKLNTDEESRFFVPQSVDKNKFTRVNFPKYIRDVAKEGYLTIMPNTFVTKILINEKNEAYGVEYRNGTYLYRASPLSNEQSRKTAPTGEIYAKREVIVSGGTFNTPQLLMLSGIGDQDHLKSFNIPVKQHLPGVGRNLMDRYELTVVNYYPNNINSLKDCLFSPTMNDPCYREYIINQTGPYISNGILSGELRRSTKELIDPDLAILNIISDFHGYFNGYSKVLPESLNSFTSLIIKARTNNTNGYVKLRSTDPFNVPNINFQYFSEGDHDLEILVQEIKRQRQYTKTHSKLYHEEVVPGPNVQSDQQIRDFIRDQAWGHHACCTAKIGRSEDPNAVLTPKFQVRGIANLRVVDASAIPRIPGYFPVVFIHMMAMKAADDITAGLSTPI